MNPFPPTGSEVTSEPSTERARMITLSPGAFTTMIPALFAAPPGALLKSVKAVAVVWLR
jgi:hypothetical protein